MRKFFRDVFGFLVLAGVLILGLEAILAFRDVHPVQTEYITYAICAGLIVYLVTDLIKGRNK